MNWRVILMFAAMPAALASEADDAVALGRQARADGVPQAAIHELKRVATQKGGEGGTPVLVELARCLIESDRESEAVEWLAGSRKRDEPEIVFWRAQALAANGDYEQALADYTLAAESDFPLREDARFGSARMLEALGRTEEALAAYGSISPASPRHDAAQLASATLLVRENRREEATHLLEAHRPGNDPAHDVQRYLEARLALEAGEAGAAERIYENFATKDRRLAAGRAIGLADARVRLQDIDGAEEILESFLRENPASPLLGDLFAKLDEIRALQKNPSNALLKQWEKDEDHPARAAAAAFYLARNDERMERSRAARNYAEFIEKYPDDPLRLSAIIRLARLHLDSRQAPQALDVLTRKDDVEDRAALAKVRFLHAMAAYHFGKYPESAKRFINAANLDPSLSVPALANAALAAIAAENDPQAAEILNALRREDTLIARRIELAQAFYAARDGSPDAGEQLAWLADRGGATAERARLALAEWRWKAGDVDGARSEFLRVANSKAAGGGSQKDYFAVFLADDGSRKAAEAVSREAREFLAAHPDSSREADVRMKWGEVLMRSGDFRGARVQFERAAGVTPDPSLKQSAWFLAARAAIGSLNPAELDAAIDLLENVAEQKSEPLASQARIEQAMLQSALGRPEDSVTILDSLVAATGDPRMRLAARIKKGEALLQMGVADKTQIPLAIAEWRAVAADPDALPAERNEALTRAAAASEQAGDSDAALAAYYEVLTAPRDSQPEYFWYYKAGFDAADLLEAGRRYKEAAAIYEKMAGAPGPRAGEAKERVKRLRLENFIWED